MSERLTVDEFAALAQRVSNWGRWGPDDSAGTLNFITPEVRRRSASLVREGIAVSCAQDLPKTPAPDNGYPTRHLVWRGSNPDTGAALDYVTLEPHGWSMTHIDALSHIYYQGRLYNDRPADTIQANGAQVHDILPARDGIVSRGILIDIPRTLGRPYLNPGEVATADDVQRALAATGETVESGDILLFRTGRYARDRALGTPPPSEGLAGISIACADWIHEREVASLICDGGMDTVPSEVDGTRIPWHIVTLTMMGMLITDNADLESLAATCAQLGRWSFQVLIAPLRLVGGTSSPVNPIALF